MAHFIQPIAGECVKHGATTPKWRTVSDLAVNTALVSTEDADEWQTSGGSVSSFEIGVSCGVTATVRFTIINPVATGGYDGVVYIDGVSEGSIGGTMPGDGVDIVEDVSVSTSGSPCGEIWEIIWAVDNGYTMTVEILSVTFV